MAARRWTQGSGALVPVDTGQLPGFTRWAFLKGIFPGDGHYAFDFGAYEREDGTCAVGLPASTRILATLDGVVSRIYTPSWGYATKITLEHGGEGEGFASTYVHVVPLVGEGQEVARGQPIATLYRQQAEGSRPEQLVHLHFELSNPWDSIPAAERYIRDRAISARAVDPESIFFPAPLTSVREHERKGTLRSIQGLPLDKMDSNIGYRA